MKEKLDERNGKKNLIRAAVCNVTSPKIVVWFNGLVPVNHVLVFCASDYEYFHHCVTIINMQEVAAEVVM